MAIPGIPNLEFGDIDNSSSADGDVDLTSTKQTDRGRDRSRTVINNGLDFKLIMMFIVALIIAFLVYKKVM